MKVTLVCFGSLRDLLPEGAISNRADLDLPDGSTAADAIDALGAPRRYVFALLIDGGRAALDAPLHEGAEVTLMPPFSGGARPAAVT
jgi:molybdopterin converting factor small subunit